MEKRWKILPADELHELALHAVLKINPVLCRILVQRGYPTYEKAKGFFRPNLADLHSPWLMKDMELAVNRILKAINSGEKVLVYGDYDVDGTTSVASMYSFLSAIYPNIDFYIPHRYKEGYGISKAGIDYSKSHDVTLIISIDCGIKAVELISYANSFGIDFIVCDHHLPDSILPDALAILNPKQIDCGYPYKELCGCGVGFKLMQALAERLNLGAETYLKYLDLVATAIAADIVPITGENRILAYYGIEKVNKDPSYGMKALLELSERKLDQITINNLVFIVAPRINAAGRMDDAKKAVLLFIEKDYPSAVNLAKQLHADNSDRREADSTITEEALRILEEDPSVRNRKTTVLYQPHWHKGVVGIVASRLIESYFRPTIVLTKSGDLAGGSARSVPGFNLYEAIHACREYLIGYGGHFAAAGMTLLPENVPAFREAFENVVTQTIEPHSLIPELIIDAEIKFSDINPVLEKIIRQMEPFGPENGVPLFLSSKVESTAATKIVKEKHIRFVLKQGNYQFNAIGFNLADKFEQLNGHKNIDIVYKIDKNEWQNCTSIQLQIIDFKPSSEIEEN